MKAERATRLFTALLVLIDMLMAALAFGLAYVLRASIPFPDPAEGMGSFSAYLPMLFVHVFSVLGVFLFARLYNLRRVSRSG